MIQNKCECKDGFTRDVTTKKCISNQKSSCGDNEIMIQNKCQCNDGFTRDVTTKKCISTQKVTCSDNEIMVQNKCECKDGFTRDVTTKKCISNQKSTCGDNEIMVQNKCECKDDYQRDVTTQTCSKKWTLVTNYRTQHISDTKPIVIKELGIIYVDEEGLCLGKDGLCVGKSWISEGTFSCSNSTSVMCGFSQSLKTRMVVTLSGIVYKNEKMINTLPLSSEHIIGISVDFSGDYQMIITSNANVYTSVDGGNHWQLGGSSSQLSQLLLPLKSLKTSSNFKSDFYVLSVEHLIRLHIKENGAIQIDEIPNKNDIIFFDIISPDSLLCLGDNKIYRLDDKDMIDLHIDVPIDLGLNRILYNDTLLYAYNDYAIYYTNL
jgi:hypothetical protein